MASNERELRTAAALWFLSRLGDDEVRRQLGIPKSDGIPVIDYLRAQAVLPESNEDAREWILAGCSDAILRGSCEPVVGARTIAEVFAGTEWPEEVTPFIALASEWESNKSYRADYDADIRAAAKEVMAARN